MRRAIARPIVGLAPALYPVRAMDVEIEPEPEPAEREAIDARSSGCSRTGSPSGAAPYAARGAWRG